MVIFCDNLVLNYFGIVGEGLGLLKEYIWFGYVVVLLIDDVV